MAVDEKAHVEAVVSNYETEILAKLGLAAIDQVRRVRTIALVDKGLLRPVIPAEMAESLGLASEGQIQVEVQVGLRVLEMARPLVRVRLELLGRHGSYRAVAEPMTRTVIIGRIVLDDLDLIVDGTSVRPRHPKYIVTEIE